MKRSISLFVLVLLAPAILAADRTLNPIFDSQYQEAQVSFDGASFHNTQTRFVNLKNQVSVVVWVKTTSTQQGMAVVASDDNNDQGRVQLFMNHGNDQELRFYLKNDAVIIADVYGYPSNSNINLQDGRWHNIAATVDLSDPSMSTFYVDGEAITTANVNGAGGQVGKLATTLYVGANHRVVPSQSTGQLITNYFIGEISKVRLYRKLLTPTEIKKIYDELR